MENRERKIYKVTVIGSIGNFLLLAFKFAAGIIGHSAAMIADAVHSLSDFITDIIVVVFVHISAKPHDEDHDYGHGKFETLATTVIAIILFFAGLLLCWNGSKTIIRHFQGEELERPGAIALIAALVSIAVKELLYLITVKTGKDVGSSAVQANAWHHRSDALSSIGTSLGIGGAMLFGAKWRVLDPIAAVVVSLFIIRVAYKLFQPCINELLEQSLPNDVEDRILKAAENIKEIRQPHNLRTRRIGNYAAVDIHVRMDGSMTVGESHIIASRLESDIKEIVGTESIVNIHVEPIKEI